MNSLLKKALTIVLSITMLLSTLTFGSATVAVAEGYVEKPIEATEDYTGLTATDGVYRVGTEAEWATLVAMGTETFAGKTVVLTADITFTSANGTIATFAGKLDGNAHTLKGVTKPLINTLNGGATIQNLIVEGNINLTANYVGVIANTVNVTADVEFSSVAVNANASGNKSTGGMIGYLATGSAKLSFKDCKVSGTIAGKSCVSGFMAEFNSSGVTATLEMENCKNSASLSAIGAFNNNLYLGGMLGYAGQIGTIATMTNCENDGDITIDNKFSSGGKHIWVGGIIARIRTVVTMQNCVNSGDITAKITFSAASQTGYAYMGGLVGQTGNGPTTPEPHPHSVFTACVNTGKVTNVDESKADSLLGGIIGYVQHYTTFTNCVNYGAVVGGNTTTAKQADAAVGGIVGTFVTGTKVEISDTYNMGSVYAADVPAGGIIAKSSKPMHLSGCVNTGNVYSNANLDGNSYLAEAATRHIAGGIVAGSYNNAATGSTITGCINTGKVMGAYSAAGILGSVQHSATFTLKDCSNSGAILSAGSTGGIIGDTAAAVTVSACYATGDYISTGANLGAIAGNAANVTVADSYASVTLNDAYTAWEGAAVSTKTEAEMLTELAVLNIDAQKSAVVDGKFDVVVLAAMNNLTDLTKVGYEVIRVVDGASNTLSPSGTKVYTDVYGYDADGNQKVVNATDYANTTYLSALKITNVSTTENVTYLYRAYAVRMVEGVEVTVYGTWSAVSFAAAEA